MTFDMWILIGALAIATFAVRLSGLFIADRLVSRPRLHRVLTDLPGCLVVALVGVSLADATWVQWGAACVALSVSLVSKNVLCTMISGMGAVAVFTAMQV